MHSPIYAAMLHVAWAARYGPAPALDQLQLVADHLLRAHTHRASRHHRHLAVLVSALRASPALQSLADTLERTPGARDEAALAVLSAQLRAFQLVVSKHPKLLREASGTLMGAQRPSISLLSEEMRNVFNMNGLTHAFPFFSCL